jgi:Fe-S-cluster containining protein
VRLIKKDTPVKTILSIANDCQKCGRCCEFGSGILIGEDLAKIAKFLKINEEELKKRYLEEVEMFNKKFLRPKFRKPYGKCVFLENKGCIIHEVKPLQCKTSKGCGENSPHLSEWFKLNYLIDKNDPVAIRQWAICLEDHKTIDGGKLSDLVPDNKRLMKIIKFKE